MKYFTAVVTAILMFVGITTVNANATTWQVLELTDEYGDVIGKGVISSGVEPKKKLEFPFEDLKANLLLECNGPIKMQFNKMNLADGTYDPLTDELDKVFEFRGRLNNQQKVSFYVRQIIGGLDEVTIIIENEFRNWLKNNHTLEVVSAFYRRGNVLFKFTTAGYQEAWQEACH